MKRTPASIPRNLQLAPKKFWGKHRTLTIVIALLILLLALVGVLRYAAYNNKFSEKDFAAIEQTAEGVFISIGAQYIDRYKHCSHEAPEKYSSVRLYCSIQLAGYLTYGDDRQAVAAAKQLEKEINKLGTTISHLDDFYQDPSNNLTGISVNFAPPLPEKQCHFTISTHEKAKKMSSFLPEKTADNLIGLSFNCSAESRKEYFPVTYRQGE